MPRKPAQSEQEFYADQLRQLNPSDADLFDLQDEQTTRSGAYSFVPSRESIKQSAQQKLKSFLGMEDIASQRRIREAEAPERVRGEYGLRGEDIRGRHAITGERERAAGGMMQQREQSRGALDVERERQSGALNQAKEYNSLYNMLSGGGQLAPGGSARIGKSGVSVTAPRSQAAPAGVQSALVDAASAGDRQAFDAALELHSAGIDPGLRQMVEEFGSLEAIQAEAANPNSKWDVSISPQEAQQLAAYIRLRQMRP